jgi:hypothetical protein
MNELRKAAENALQALHTNLSYMQCNENGEGPDCTKVIQSISNLSAALSQPEQEPVAWMFSYEGDIMLSKNKDSHLYMMGKAERSPLYTTPPAIKRLNDGWISVKDALPQWSEGASIGYGHKGTGVVLVITSDRPDYPLTAHASYSNQESCNQGVAIPTNGLVEGFDFIEWFSAPLDLQNPFKLKSLDSSKCLPSRFGRTITHWAPLLELPKEGR